MQIFALYTTTLKQQQKNTISNQNLQTKKLSVTGNVIKSNAVPQKKYNPTQHLQGHTLKLITNYCRR